MMSRFDKWVEKRLGKLLFDLVQYLGSFAIVFSFVLVLGLVIAGIKAR